MKSTTLLLLIFLSLLRTVQADDTINIGMNYPQTGPYMHIGIDQERGAQMALEEINQHGGILGKKIIIYRRDSKSNPDTSALNVKELIDQKNVKMVFGGASSGVAIRVSDVCQTKKTLFMATVTSANATTGAKGHRHTFRTCYSAWMGGKALGTYLKKHFPADSNTYYYIVADYSWGRSAEASIRKFSGTEDTTRHRVSYTQFPGVTDQALADKLKLAKIRKATVLIFCHFGSEMTRAVQVATQMGLKEEMQIVVPILELSMAEGAGAEAMEGIVGTSDFNWQVPFSGQYEKGMQFVNQFAENYGRYPSWGAAKAYTILWEYKHAVERSGSFAAADVIRALEDHSFTLLKDEEQWRSFDHQNVQTVFLVRCRSKEDVINDRYQLDYFEIIDSLPGNIAARSFKEWQAARWKANIPSYLEKLPAP